MQDLDNDALEPIYAIPPSNKISQDCHPSKVTIQIHSVNLDDISRMTLRLRNFQKTIPTIAYAHAVDFTLTYHSLLFDILKIDVQRQQFLSHSRVAQAAIKLSNLDYNHHCELHTFDLVDIHRKQILVGSITIRMSFQYGLTKETISFLELENFKPPGSSAESAKSAESTGVPDIDKLSQSVFLGSNTKGVSNEIVLNCQGTPSRTEGSNSTDSMGRGSIFNSRGSKHKHKSRCAKEGYHALNNLVKSLKSTGWNLSTADFARGMAAMQDYNLCYPHTKTMNTITDISILKTGAYFIQFSMASYGAFALNCFGYGKVTDMLKINKDRKSAIAHLRMKKRNMLRWEYGAHGLFSNKPCFFICFDEITQSIILSIRGTFGIGDTITDLHGAYVNFFGGSAHDGCVQSAMWIQLNYYQKLIFWIKKYDAKALNIVGHSLGGSISTCLLMMIREELINRIGGHFTVKAYNYGPPPSVSSDLAAKFEAHIVNFIGEHDCVSACSYGSVMDFKELLALAAKQSKDSAIPKIKRMANIHELSQNLISSNKHPRLIIPGKLYYIYKSKAKDGHNTKESIKAIDSHYVVEQSLPEHFTNIHARRDMIFHHFVNKYDGKLRKAIEWLSEKQQ